MAINKVEVSQKNNTIRKVTPSVKSGNTYSLEKVEFVAEECLPKDVTNINKFNKNKDIKSPYLASDKVQLLSNVSVKKLNKRKENDQKLYFLQTDGIYRARSDELRMTKRNKKKMKKSKLTLPNNQAITPQICTVSDMNDSEYFNRSSDNSKQEKKPKKKIMRRKPLKKTAVEIYDKDAKYCSQLNKELDCSSTDMIKFFKGDGKKLSNPLSKSNGLKAHDVWTVLRNINNLQLGPSPPESDESFVTTKTARKIFNKRSTCMSDPRVIERVKTEEIAYISSIEVNSNSYSPSSSQDRITVIKNYKNFQKIFQTFDKSQTVKPLKSPPTCNKLKPNSQIMALNKNIRTINKSKQKLDVIGNVQDSTALNKNIRSINKSKQKLDVLGNVQDSTAIIKSIKKYNENQYHSIENTSLTKISDNGSSKCHIIPSGKSSKAALRKVHEKENRKCSKQINTIEQSLQTPTGPKLLSPKSNINQNGTLIKSRLITTLPSANKMLKLTQAEIRRRLSKLKYPIVILGKDQLSSTVQVANFEPVQFMGLDKHIWPFMVDWYERQTQDNFGKINHSKTISLNKPLDVKTLMLQAKTPTKKEKVAVAVNKKKNYTVKIKTEPQKINSILHVKNRVTQSIRKNSPVIMDIKKTGSDLRVNDRSVSYEQNDITNTNVEIMDSVDIGSETKINSEIMRHNNGSVCDNMKNRYNKNGSYNLKYRWAKAKRASEFIENVITKIRNGVYYSVDSYESKLYNESGIEVCVQTSLDNICKCTCGSRVFVTLNDVAMEAIPEFDVTLPALEIKSFNKDEIIIKHCITNIIIQFDVKNSFETEPLLFNLQQKSLTLTPLKVTESATKVFKCNKTLLNAMLPAEVCTIVPKIMQKLIESANSSNSLNISLTIIDSSLPYDLEVSESKVADIREPILPTMSRTMKNLLREGKYKNHPQKLDSPIISTIHKLNMTVSETSLVKNVLSTIRTPIEIKVDPVNIILTPQFEKISSLKPINASLQNTFLNNCTTLQCYDLNKRRLFPSFPYLDVVLMAQIWLINYNLKFYIINGRPSLKTFNNVFNKYINPSSYRTFELEFPGNLEIKTDDLKSIEQLPRPVNACTNISVDGVKNEKKDKNTKKTRKNCYNSMYRKCKSSSSISTDKRVSLAKITSLENFFEALGTAKAMSSVFQGSMGSKILSCIIEMKSWITEISPQQAMLILMLTNKKETQNLVRFRPVLLQGIAVNRITKASELDMEIEVIEKENIIFPQFEGISYLPASAENKDHLLEELTWIAKTTAADYNRIFDESSEKLLKFLLHKRKNLNPSYLRVMARYVGLGLLKEPHRR